MTTPGKPQLRIGNDERESAYKALDAHLTAGRLDAEEYGDRYAQASLARYRSDLDVLFEDLPEPHPFTPPPQAPTWSGSPWAGARAKPARPRPLGGRLGATLVAIAPFVALALCFGYGAWYALFLIPVVGTLIYGPRDGRRGHPRSRGFYGRC